MRARLLILLSLFCWEASASKVIAVSESQKIIGVTHGLKEWEVGESVCVISNEEEVACGPVTRSGPTVATVRIETRSARIVVGMDVGLSNAAIQGSYYRVTQDPMDWFDFRNVTLGMMTRSPTGHFQQAFAEQFALGFIPQYLNATLGNVEANGVGTLGTLSFYFNQLYQGLNLTAAGGVYLIYAKSLGAEDQTICPSVLLLMGYRYSFFNNVNFGFSFGPQYFHSLSLDKIPDFKFNGFRFVFAFDWGFAF